MATHYTCGATHFFYSSVFSAGAAAFGTTGFFGASFFFGES